MGQGLCFLSAGLPACALAELCVSVAGHGLGIDGRQALVPAGMLQAADAVLVFHLPAAIALGAALQMGALLSGPAIALGPCASHFYIIQQSGAAFQLLLLRIGSCIP